MNDNLAKSPEQTKYDERLKRIENAVALKETDRIPFAPFFDGVVQRFYGSNYRDIFYGYRDAGEAVLKFYKDYPYATHTAFPVLRAERQTSLPDAVWSTGRGAPAA